MRKDERFFSRMNVLAIFQDDYNGALSGAVWMIDTVANRVRFEESTGLDSNSALFSIGRYNSRQSALLCMIWGIHDHYRDVATITVVGVGLDKSTARELQGDYDITATKDGFICRPLSKG